MISVDFLSATFPDGVGQCLLRDLRPVLTDAGAVLDSDGLYRFPAGGTLRLLPRGNVDCFSLSGAGVAAVTLSGGWSDLLWSINEYPYRITRLDSCLDLHVSAPPVLAGLYSEAQRGLHRLTQRALRPHQIKRIMSPPLYPSDASETGTVYLGNPRSAEVSARAYDKRQERLFRGAADPGDMLRYELVVKSGVSASLADVGNPAPLFWHFMGQTILDAPENSVPWVAGGVGFDLQRPREKTPMEILKRKVERSAELRDIIAMADACGPAGRSFLKRMIDAAPRPEPAPDQRKVANG